MEMHSAGITAGLVSCTTGQLRDGGGETTRWRSAYRMLIVLARRTGTRKALPISLFGGPSILVEPSAMTQAHRGPWSDCPSMHRGATGDATHNARGTAVVMPRTESDGDGLLAVRDRLYGSGRVERDSMRLAEAPSLRAA